jgi:hypothetical protein
MGQSLCLQRPCTTRATMGKSPVLAMDTHGKGDDWKIAGACGISNVGQVNGVRGECNQNNNHLTTDNGCSMAVALDDNG